MPLDLHIALYGEIKEKENQRMFAVTGYRAAVVKIKTQKPN
jgi:hypothetical protein